MTSFTPAQIPTMIFIGVTTGKSSINRVFPKWAETLGLGPCQLIGMDFKLHDDPAKYREAVAFIKADPLSLGALVTTHKIDLYNACRDLFDEIDPLAAFMGEASSLCKSPDGSRLVAQAVDPITSSLALQAFLPDNHWVDSGGEALILGAGGAAMALTWSLMQAEHGANRPRVIQVADRDATRLEEMKRMHARLKSGVAVNYHLTDKPELADALCRRLPESSLVVNATGLGKDAPGSPLTDAAPFPVNGYVWEFNYRGDLVFLEQARAQAAAKNLIIEDGWTYFLHGWTRVMANVFHADIPTKGPVFDELSNIAAALR